MQGTFPWIYETFIRVLKLTRLHQLTVCLTNKNFVQIFQNGAYIILVQSCGTIPFSCSNYVHLWYQRDLYHRVLIHESKHSTPSVPKCRSFDFFGLKFDRSSYSKNLYKHSQIQVILEILLLLKQVINLNKTSGQTWAQ